jgi:uncharacterized protein
MNFVPLVLGVIPFTVSTATHNRITKNYSSRWASQSRVNNTPSLQNTGTQRETINISGVTFPNDNLGAKATLVALRELAATDTSTFMFDLDGLIYGKWSITNIQEESTNGDKTNYNIGLTRYPDSSLLDHASAVVKGV